MVCSRYIAIIALSVVCVGYPQAQSNVRTITVIFTTIDVPGAVYTGINGINSAGDMVGTYGQDTSQDGHGFLYSNGTFTYFDFPGKNFTVAQGVNDLGIIVGHAGKSPIVSFLYDGSNFTTLKDGNNSSTFAVGINNSGYVVGGAGTIYTTKGFEMRNGRYKTLQVPGSYVYIDGAGINNLGTVVGWADDDGFVCASPSNCRVVGFPGATQTETLGINDAGVIVGWYFSSSCHDCAFATKQGKFISLAFPGAAGTFAAGINNLGQIVGQYTFDYNVWHGFVTNPITDADFQ